MVQLIARSVGEATLAAHVQPSQQCAGPEDVSTAGQPEASPSAPGAHSQALNVTLSYAGTLNFGFIGCRDTLPHLQRLAVYTGRSARSVAAADGAAGLGS